MGCSESKSPSTPPPSDEDQGTILPSTRQIPSAMSVREDVLLQIPGCRVHLIDGPEALQLAAGDFNLVQVSDNGVSLAMIIRVGRDLQWPVTKDEPVVKLDSRDYLFTLPVKDGDPLSYGVTFSGHENDVEVVNSLELLDDFLKENSCFSASFGKKMDSGIDWKEFAPKIEDYNNVLAKAIAGGTGHIIRGIFRCSNAYTNQVQKGGETMITSAEEKKNGGYQRNGGYSSGSDSRRKSGINRNLARYPLMDLCIVSGSVMAPVMKSKPGKAFFSMVPGEVLLASLDAINKILDAAEAAEKQAFSATSKAATRMVSQRFGESAGEATGEVLATAGHAAGTAWNVVKIRKALYPSSSVTSGIIKNATRK
ncbi:PREDICTED: senescence/dehydration-associated protein At4g35985, chloroplastic-like isoform X2 [Tarenaya hassleriana]|uniref:senescence/dehydration-associated protein At4g35985, chloroplastic-like isoform X2 n=1 Tax=Tarenaya hassleriana TaxID=28532 RepID=UPI00053C804C|nr:PREDICTED: senescence/dehydration-associated protein At4g35985, chloroplastic-like isoform X2 [Tarenaya hassleriana]